eukprot:TRINITY_DN2027_c0_g1_i1.p1 TRINITY_DN2027_c0_g1~~TRINITY_DN2027_c0_g1_i1.p1  ORF type:complete len:166 (+),score=12.06 TRINITY_DN2027_c0_g1_i1:55-552(+)
MIICFPDTIIYFLSCSRGILFISRFDHFILARGNCIHSLLDHHETNNVSFLFLARDSLQLVYNRSCCSNQSCISWIVISSRCSWSSRSCWCGSSLALQQSIIDQSIDCRDGSNFCLQSARAVRPGTIIVSVCSRAALAFLNSTNSPLQMLSPARATMRIAAIAIF